ncbi:Protein PHLOEM PROTEIN 2-LIKE A1 [Acorus gramineus]|uniref:Protein PHLOEM PROTEIN 2-LIKE A1 n=1 Tax=Acorus gramineus TaxID=55184 RepID=A0AAV9BTA4_ACOGR|nr:Protein PHLOEM PROTEIN 2-LIKE A1 [Acorus gramineus]
MGLVLARETTKNAPEDVKTQWSQKRLPHNFEAIVKEADDDQGDLQRILRSGIFLNQKKGNTLSSLMRFLHKYWVDKSGYNCFTVYARDLSITWSSEQRYWHWLPLNDYSSEADIAVASLQNVCWLEVQGKLDASHLSPEVTYEVAFLVMMKDSSSGWHDLVTLSLKYPGGDKHDRKVLPYTVIRYPQTSLATLHLQNRWETVYAPLPHSTQIMESWGTNVSYMPS